MLKNGKNKKYIILIILVVVGILVVVTTIAVKENRKLNFFEKAIKDSTTFVTGTIYKPIGFIKDKIKENDEKNKIYKQYKKLKEKADKATLYEARIKELEGEIDNLKKSLDINQTITDYKKINASVVNRNVGAWYNTVNINKGSKAGIKEGYAVITDKGLIGKVVSVSNFTSTVKLLSTDEVINKISVKIEVDDKSIYGLLSYYDKKNNDKQNLDSFASEEESISKLLFIIEHAPQKKEWVWIMDVLDDIVEDDEYASKNHKKSILEKNGSKLGLYSFPIERFIDEKSSLQALNEFVSFCKSELDVELDIL